MTDIVSIDPRTASIAEVVSSTTTPQEVDALCVAAAAAAPALERLGRAGRAAVLRAMADALESRGEDIVGVADRETGIGPTRLAGELKRTCYQLRLFAEVLEDGGYLEATIDHAGTPRWVRDRTCGGCWSRSARWRCSGPATSRWPSRYPGGDTASALAAGSPVILKAHSSHPATSALCFELLLQGARAAGAPEGTVGIVYGQRAGSALVAHPAIKAVGFTGSLGGGGALMKIIAERAEPIPFYGELSSLNPVVITEAAAAERGDAIGAGLVASFTVAAGQLCTKPGLVFLPTGSAGDGVVAVDDGRAGRRFRAGAAQRAHFRLTSARAPPNSGRPRA